MRAIRGATTIFEDSPREIREAVAELLEVLCERNALSADAIDAIIFSNTADIRSLYPAKAAREAGFSSTALFSAQEPDMEGALSLCIRLLAFAEGDAPPVPVYLRGAASLRKDLGKFAVALDGPSGSGKSTVAKRLARELDILYLDTGAMYRACALAVHECGADLSDEAAIARIISAMRLRIEYRGGAQHTVLNDRDVSEEIRRPEVSMAASKVSVYGCVREKMVEMQRKIAAEQSCVLDGRDIGTAVLPNAEFKFFVTASVPVRARRRYDELCAKGFQVDYAALEKEIEERDKNDSTRAISPLRRADDAVLIDTSELSIDEVVASIRRRIQEKV